jgi:hypothetical protein
MQRALKLLLRATELDENRVKLLEPISQLLGGVLSIY